jgi:hypothetical protein
MLDAGPWRGYVCMYVCIYVYMYVDEGVLVRGIPMLDAGPWSAMYVCMYVYRYVCMCVYV